MNGCEGCLTTAKGLARAYDTKRTEAIKWSNENQKSVALYQEGYNVLFIEAQIAVNLGYHIREIITYKPE